MMYFGPESVSGQVKSCWHDDHGIMTFARTDDNPVVLSVQWLFRSRLDGLVSYSLEIV